MSGHKGVIVHISFGADRIVIFYKKIILVEYPNVVPMYSIFKLIALQFQIDV